MWKDEKPIIPFNEIKHLSVDNFGFVNGLRRSASLESQIQKFKEAKRLDEEAAATTKFLKPTNCINSQCMTIGPHITEALAERAEILNAIQAATMELMQQTEVLETLEAESDKAAGHVLALNHEIEALEEKESVTLRKKLTKISVDKRDLVAQIAKMNKKLKYWQDKKPKPSEAVNEQHHQHHEDGPRDPDKLYFEHYDVNKKGPPRKHNGVYMALDNGRYCWSCCNNSDEHCHGCIDDHSVNVRHTLANMKRQFHNYIDYPIHPLVSTSSVVLRGHNAMVVERQMSLGHNRALNASLSSSGGIRRPVSALSTFSVSSPVKNTASTMLLPENSLLHASVSQSLDAMNRSSVLHSTKLHQQSTTHTHATTGSATAHSRPQSAALNHGSSGAGGVRPATASSRPTSAALSRPQSAVSTNGAARRSHSSHSLHGGHSTGPQFVSYEPVDLSKLPPQRGSWRIPIHTNKPMKFLPLHEPPSLEVAVEEDTEPSPRLDQMTASPHSHHTYDSFLPSHASGGVLPHPASEPEIHAPQWMPTHHLVVDHAKDFNDSLFSAALPHVSGGLHSGGSYINAGRPKSGLIGRVRAEPNREFNRKNRPMASPDGFALYMK